jgi:hypothetical protein
MWLQCLPRELPYEVSKLNAFIGSSDILKTPPDPPDPEPAGKVLVYQLFEDMFHQMADLDASENVGGIIL